MFTEGTGKTITVTVSEETYDFLEEEARDGEGVEDVAGRILENYGYEDDGSDKGEEAEVPTA